MKTVPKNLKRTVSQSTGDTHHGGGMNLLTQPERLAPGQAQDILNLLWDGGSLTTRPGMVGQLTTAHGAAVYLSRYRYMMSDGTARIPYSTGGKVYYFAVGGAAGVEITKPGPVSFTFSSPAVRYVVIGRWLYFLDSSDSSGSVWRVNLSSSTVAQQVSGLAASILSPLASLRSAGILAGSLGAATWASVGAAATNFVPSGQEDFPSGSTYWEYRAGATAAGNMESDDPSGSPGTSPSVAIDADAGSLDYVGLAAVQTLVTTCPKILFVEARYSATDASTVNEPAQYLQVTLFGCDSSGNRIVALVQGSTPGFRFPTRYFRHAFDLRPYPSVTKFDIELTAPDAVGVIGVDVRQISITQPGSDLDITNSSGTALVQQGDGLLFNSTLYVSGMSAKATITSINLSALDNVVVDIKRHSNVASALPMRMGFKVGSSWFYSPGQSITDESETAFDISLIKASLTAVVQIAFEFTGDITLQSGTASASTNEIFRVSQMRSAGSLTPLVPLSYIWTQVVSTSTDYNDVTLESGGSKFSNFITPTVAQSRAKVDLRGEGGGSLSLDSSTTHLAVYRLGGATPDGDTRARLLGLFPVGSDATSPALTTQDSQSNEYFWDVSEWTLYDNITDDSLVAVPVYQLSRDQVPTGCTALTHHAGRLWLAKYDATYGVNNVYASWLLDGINDFPYVSEELDQDDPEIVLKGKRLSVGGQGSGDRIVAFSTATLDAAGGNRGGSLMVLRQSAPPSIISGDSPINFVHNPSPVDNASGCLAPEGVQSVNGATIYLSSSGITSTQGFTLENLSEAIQKRLSLNAIGKSRYAQGFLCWHDSRLWCIMPGSGSTDGEALVLDMRDGMHGWGRVSGYLGLGFTSACSLSDGLDTGDLYIGGRDGQIYRMGGTPYSPTFTTDKATPSGTARAIAWSYLSRRYGQQASQTPRLVSLNRPRALFFDFTAGEAFTLTWTVTNEKSQSTSGTFAHPSGRTEMSDIREFADTRAMTHATTLSGSVSTTLTMHSELLEIEDLGQTR
jgi:hypothetical protein